MSATQDAADGARLLEAPNPFVLLMVVVPSWRRQRRETRVALRAILTRLVPPGALTRPVLPTILARLVAPLLAGPMVIPTSSTLSTTSAVAPVIALGTSIEASILNVPKLLTIIGVVCSHVVEGAKRTAAFGRLRKISAALGVWFFCEYGHSLALHVLDLGLLLLWLRSRELEEGETPLLSPRTLGFYVEQLQGRAQLLMDGEILLHLDIMDAFGKH